MVKHGAIKLTPDKLRSLIKKLTHSKKLWIAYSGGLDSHVLLHLVYHAFANYNHYKIAAIHIHHGLSTHADKWVMHCEKICAELEIPLTILYVDAQVKEGESPEEAARMARLAAWKNFIQPGESLLLAHHASDQTETILLRLFRGAGPTGLGGMSMRSTMGDIEIIRPLLEIAKEDIIHYATTHHLNWIEDESNQNIRFDRNFLRHEILPMLLARWPRVIRSINRSGNICLETATALQILAEKDLQSIQPKDNNKNNDNKLIILSVKKLLTLEPQRRQSVIRHWLQTQGFSLPSRDHTERIDREIIQAKNGSKPRLKISNYEVRRIKDELMVNYC